MTAQSNEHYDVGVVGVSFGANYGSVLTYYSLYKTIQDFGNKVLMVSKIGAHADDPEVQDTHAMRFASEHYNWSKIYNQDTVGDLNRLADTFVIGSDQVWNYGISRGFGKAFYLDFVNDDKRKISYAASFGHIKDLSPSNEIPKISALMKRFNAISVREDSGVSIAQGVYGVPATQVAEPIFLTDAQHYRDLASRSSRDVSTPYLLAYILDPTPEKKAAIEHVAAKLGLKPRIILDAWPHLFEENKAKMAMDDAIEDDLDAYDFLKLYANSSYVVTDSFHGTAFALKFEKPFASIGNRRRGVARFDSLFQLVGHRERFTLKAEDIVARDADFLAPLDYTDIRRALDSHVAVSKKWLKAALKKRVRATIAAKQNLWEKPGLRFARRVARKARRVVRSARDRQRFQLNAPSFTANNDAWRVEKRPEGTRIRVTAPAHAAERGNFTWTDLPASLHKDTAYELTIDWTVQSTSPVINVHLRNPQSGQFKVIGKIEVGNNHSATRTDRIAFRTSDAGFSQIMFGALNFGGTDGGATVSRITLQSVTERRDDARSTTPERIARRTKYVIRERRLSTKPRAQKSAADAQLPSVGTPKPRSTEPIAVPEHTPNREERITAVLSDHRVAEWKSDLAARLPELTFYVGRELKEYTNNKVGGPADILAFPKTVHEVHEIIALANEHRIAVTVLGRGSNVLVRDGGVRGIVIMTTDLKFFKLESDSFTVGSGAGLIEAAFYLLNHGRTGLEWAAGIPGTIGGAVYMNAGTYTSDVRRNLISTTVIDADGNVFSLMNDDIDWGVRFTTFQNRKDWIVLDATFKTRTGVNVEMARKMVGTVQARENSMPMESPNHGSTFKWYRAPRLIKQAGLVGTRIGGAKISTKQPGFIINVKQATASDYEALINYTIAKVYDFCGFMLEPEVEIIGELPHRYKRYPKNEDNDRLE